jgi:hypothetical protein
MFNNAVAAGIWLGTPSSKAGGEHKISTVVGDDLVAATTRSNALRVR